MRICTSFILIVFSFGPHLSSAAQKVTTLSVKIKGVDTGSVVQLRLPTSNSCVDSYTALSDSFNFRFSTTKGDMYFVSYKTNKNAVAWPFYLQPGTHTKVVFKENQLVNVDGSAIAVEQNDFYQQSKNLHQQYLKLDSQVSATTDTNQLKRLKNELSKSVLSIEAFTKNWITQHQYSPFSIGIIKYYMSDIPADTLENLYNNLLPQAKANSSLAESMLLFFTETRAQQALKYGEQIKDFTLKDTSDTEHSFYNLKGENYVLLDLWASWCGPCRASTPEIIKLLETYKEYNFKVISISADTEKKKWTKAIVEDSMYWTQLSDLKGTEGGFMKSNSIFSYPTYVIVSPAGIILSKPWDIDGVKKSLAEIFKETVSK